MKIEVVWCVGVLAALTVLTTTAHRIDKRVVLGKQAKEKEHPWMARLAYTKKNKRGTTIKHQCGGTLINQCYILTALHCIKKSDWTMATNTVYLGDHDKIGEGKVFKLRGKDNKFTIRKLQNLAKGLDKDIVLLKLSECVEITDKIKPICLSNKSPDAGDVLHVYGWGQGELKTPADPRSDEQKNVPSQEILRTNQDKISRVPSTQKGNKFMNTPFMALFGDSGGPWIRKQKGYLATDCQFGIVMGALGNRRHGIMKDVSQYLTAIRTVIRKHPCPEECECNIKTCDVKKKETEYLEGVLNVDTNGGPGGDFTLPFDCPTDPDTSDYARLFPDPYSCEHFYHCDLAGIPRRKLCAMGHGFRLHWNKAKKECDFPANAGCA